MCCTVPQTAGGKNEREREEKKESERKKIKQNTICSMNFLTCITDSAWDSYCVSF
jgi:hypothetical protein